MSLMIAAALQIQHFLHGNLLAVFTSLFSCRLSWSVRLPNQEVRLYSQDRILSTVTLYVVVRWTNSRETSLP